MPLNNKINLRCNVYKIRINLRTIPGWKATLTNPIKERKGSNVTTALNVSKLGKVKIIDETGFEPSTFLEIIVCSLLTNGQ